MIAGLLLISISSMAQDFSWLTGRWVGPGFGGVFEEVWSEPDVNGHLMGMFRYADSAGAVQFYEFWVLDETGLKLRHFNPDFTAWETKDEFIDFSMIKSTQGLLELKGLIYELIGEDQLKISLDLKHGDTVRTEVFILKRQ
ncbi:hypothetical protein C7460_109121 [Marinoscillum furvescens DSM 4134]|uniref:DUF6265 domain-containing protein n=2 Tax=Marinoscillum furvescens TaxID=1026 RepID=A0A3D9L2G5_MARFU|nr:hypothetical protein C7460_109121 [Marinoscillum furvescens DSM 4134]